jgi:hypothetical protein
MYKSQEKFEFDVIVENEASLQDEISTSQLKQSFELSAIRSVD